MSEEVTVQATVKASVGLHARPAAALVQAVGASGHEVLVSKGGSAPVNAASILSIIGLGAKQGEVVTLSVAGERAAEVANQLVELIESADE